MFDPEKFRDDISEEIEKMLKNVPDEWKADMAAFISMQAVIFGADNTYEGMGIFEANKIEYLDICNEIMEEDDVDLSLN
jgi:hypothetical protein